MSDNLRDRIAAIIDTHTAVGAEGQITCWCDSQRFEGFHAHSLHAADAVIRELGWRQEWSVERDYPKFPHYGGGERGIDHCCNECDAATTLDSRELAAHLRDDLNARDSRFQAELLTRYVTEWENAND